LFVQKGENGPIEMLRAFNHDCIFPHKIDLQPGQMLSESIFVSADVCGWKISEPGTYYINYIANEGQVNQSTFCKQVVVKSPNSTSLDETGVTSSSLRMFPNPGRGKVTFEASSTIRFVLISQLGQVLDEVELNSENEFQKEINGLKPGVYFLNATDGSSGLHQKLIILD